MNAELDMLRAIALCEELGAQTRTAMVDWIVTQVSGESGVDADQLGAAWTRKLLAAATARTELNNERD